MEHNILLAAFIFLAAAVAVVPFAKATGLGAVLGYLIAGVAIGPYGLRLVTDPETILHFSEFGVVMMLFIIGLELQPRELWRLRDKLIGMGLTQVVVTAILFGAVAWLVGTPWQSAIVIGLALALSSTAIVLQIMGERGMMTSDTGRSGFSVLLLQDIAIIPILAVIPLLALPHLAPAVVDAAGHAGEAPPEPDAWLALRIVLVFGGMWLAGRFLLRPIMRFIAKSGVREIFTALALFLVVGAALLMEWLGLSAALGAFMVGVMLANSEYRHELETDIDPFKGLLLGLFFISVGMSIEFIVIAEGPVTIFVMVLALIAIKMAVLYVIARSFKLDTAEALLFAMLLAQGGEFAFVLLQFALGAGALEQDLADRLNVTVALSMAITPLMLLAFDRLIAPRLVPRTPEPGIPDMGDTRQKVLVLGYGRFGQISTRLLQAQGFETTLIDHDPGQIELVQRFGFKVFYGDAGRLDLLRAAGAGEAQLVLVSLGNKQKITEICRMLKDHFPHTPVLARAVDRGHAFELMELGVEFERESFLSSLHMGTRALVALGYEPHRAARLTKAFERHDMEMLEESYKLRGDEEAFTHYIRQSRDMLYAVMQSDREHIDQNPGNAAWTTEEEDSEAEARARSD